jgi:MFS family permease
MDTAVIAASIFLSVPFGGLGDRIGRKKSIYLTRLIGILFYVMLVFAPGPEYLVIAGMLQGIYLASNIVYITMAMELVPQSQKGRWIGFNTLFAGLLSAPASIVGGLIWEYTNPMNLLLISMIIDVLSLQLLVILPETHEDATISGTTRSTFKC